MKNLLPECVCVCVSETQLPVPRCFPLLLNTALKNVIEVTATVFIWEEFKAVELEGFMNTHPHTHCRAPPVWFYTVQSGHLSLSAEMRCYSKTA